MSVDTINGSNSTSNKISKKRYIIIAAIVLVILFIGFGIYFYISTSNKNGTIKLSKNMVKEKSYDSLKIVDIKGYKEDKYKHLTFTVKNITDKDYKNKPTNIVFFDSKDKEIYKVSIVIPEIASGDVGKVDLVLDNDAFKAENFRISD